MANELVIRHGVKLDGNITPSSGEPLLGRDSSTGVVTLENGISEQVFLEDVTFILSSGKSFGKYTNGQTAPWEGLTVIQALVDAATEYIAPTFGSFSVSGQATTVEVGTTLSGSKTFTWSITENSGDVNTIDIVDLTAGTTIADDTPNDGSQSVTITTLQLNSNGATQQWRGVGLDDNNSNTFNSNTFTVTSRYYRFFGPTDAEPTNSSEVRALPSSAFQTGTGTFTFETGDEKTIFVIALPPGFTLSSVVDLDALNANITGEFESSTISVSDAGSTSRTYNLYVMEVVVPYSTSHTFQVTVV